MSGDININGGKLTGVFSVGHGSTVVHTENLSGRSGINEVSFEKLSRELISHGLSDNDISELRIAISTDSSSSDVAQGKIGSNVKSWMQKMFGNAVDTVWQIEIGMAGSILASAISRYYGWP